MGMHPRKRFITLFSPKIYSDYRFAVSIASLGGTPPSLGGKRILLRMQRGEISYETAERLIAEMYQVKREA